MSISLRDSVQPTADPGLAFSAHSHFARVIAMERESLARFERSIDQYQKDIDIACSILSKQKTHVGSRIVVSGVGKAGIIGRKVAATLSSLGMAANFIHPVEGLHGDLGFIKSDDVALLFSYSGETIELLRLAQHLRRINCEAVAVTSDAQNSLARLASASILTGRVEEACRFGLAPSSSTTLMLAIGDALALSIAAVNGFSEEEFARNHPAGTIGLKLFRVESFMRSGDRLVCVRPTDTVRHVLEKVCSAKTGAAVLINEDGTLAGIFTDGDLRRALIRNRDAVELVVSSFATCPCHSIASDYTLADAHGIFSTTRTEDLPVVDRMNRKVVGMLCLKDISQL